MDIQTFLDCSAYSIEGMSNLEVLYELLLEHGFSLTESIEGRCIAGATVYSISYSNFFVYFNGTIDRSAVVALGNGIVDRCREMNIEVIRQVIFRFRVVMSN